MKGRPSAGKGDAQRPTSGKGQHEVGLSSKLGSPFSAANLAVRPRTRRICTDLHSLAPPQTPKDLLESLPVNRVRVVKVELAPKRQLELVLIMPLVERILREDNDVGDVIEGREDLLCNGSLNIVKQRRQLRRQVEEACRSRRTLPDAEPPAMPIT